MSSVHVTNSPPRVVRVISDEGTSLVVANSVTRLVRIVAEGPQGPPGAPGGADARYHHTQIVPASTWTITHNLGRQPSVTIIDSANDQVVGDVHYPSNDQVIVSFTAAFAGQAALN